VSGPGALPGLRLATCGPIVSPPCPLDARRLTHPVTCCPASPGPLTLAAVRGSTVAIAAGAHVAALLIDPSTGAPSVVATAELAQQASALALIPAPPPPGGASGMDVDGGGGGPAAAAARGDGTGLLVAAGLWVENAVMLLKWPAAGGDEQHSSGGAGHPALLEPACRLELDDEQPRSLAALDVAGRTVVLAGTSKGQVGCVARAAGQGAAGSCT
jgi:hypothetical protein